MMALSRRFQTPTKLALAALIATAMSARADVTISSDPVGYYRIPLTAGFQSVGFSLMTSPEFVSLVETSDTDSVSSTESEVDIGALLDAEKAYYIEVVFGPVDVNDEFVGHRFEVDVTETIDVDTADGDIVLSMGSNTNTVFALPDLAGYRIELRPHITLVEAFPHDPLYADFDFGLADQVQVYNGTSFTAFFLLGTNGQGALKGWFTFGGTPVDDLVILPGQGMLYKRSANAPTGVDLVMSGKVRANPFYQRLDPGFNFVSEPFPVSASFNTRNAFPVGFEPNFDIGLADQVQVFDGTGFTSYYLAGTVETNVWFLTTLFTPQNDTIAFDYRRSVFVKKTNFTTDYRVPLGWNP